MYIIKKEIYKTWCCARLNICLSHPYNTFVFCNVTLVSKINVKNPHQLYLILNLQELYTSQKGIFQGTH